jgi:hypothetical protein
MIPRAGILRAAAVIASATRRVIVPVSDGRTLDDNSAPVAQRTLKRPFGLRRSKPAARGIRGTTVSSRPVSSNAQTPLWNRDRRARQGSEMRGKRVRIRPDRAARPRQRHREPGGEPDDGRADSSRAPDALGPAAATRSGAAREL